MKPSFFFLKERKELMRNESKVVIFGGNKVRKLNFRCFNWHHRPIWRFFIERFEKERKEIDPKVCDPNLCRAKPLEKMVEARSDSDVQIDRQI